MKTLFLNTGLFTKQHQRKIFVAIIGIGLVLRVVISFFLGLPNIHRDTLDYFAQANAILEGGYTNFFPNGYPMLIALARTVAGDMDITALIWLSILMSTAIIFFVYSIAQKVFSCGYVALVAALIVALFPSQINYSRWLTSEVPATFFIVGAFFFYLKKRHFLAGLFLGLATVVRTEFLPIGLLLIISDIVATRKLRLFSIAGILIPIVLISWYCYLKTGEFSVSGHTRINILCSITASGSYIDWNYADKHAYANTTAKAWDLYINEMRTNTSVFLKNRVLNLWEMWALYPTSADGTRSVASRLLIGLSNLFLLVFGLFAWVKNYKRHKVFILILPFAVITAVHIVFFAMQRYTYPVEPFMIILASWACVYWAKRPAKTN